MTDGVADPVLLIVAARLVAVVHEGERRVVAEVAEEAVAFGLEPGIDGSAVADTGFTVGPGGALDVEVHPEFIGGLEGSGGWRPGVEGEVVEAVGAGDGHQVCPVRHGLGWVSREREDGTFDRAAEEDATAA